METMIAMGVLLIGGGGLISAQLSAVRQNQLGKRMGQASTLLTELSENIARWDYNDARLTPLIGVTDFSSTEISSRWEMGGEEASAYDAQYGEMSGDSNAGTSGALDASYQGLSADFDGDGTQDLYRYWNVFEVDLANSGTPDGKFVQLIVRWRMGTGSFRQITGSTFKRNPGKVF
jgi:hypothetical protein